MTQPSFADMNSKSCRFMVFLCSYDATFLNRSRANQWFELILPEQGEDSQNKNGSEAGNLWNPCV